MIDKSDLIQAVENMSMSDDTVEEARAAIAQLESLGIPIPKRLRDRVDQAQKLGGIVGVLAKLLQALGNEVHVPTNGASQLIFWVWRDSEGYHVKPIVRDFGHKERLGDKLVRSAVASGYDAALQCFDVNPKRPAPKA